METGNIRKEIKDIKKTQIEILQLKNTATKVKYSLDELSGRKQATDEIVIYRDQRKLPNLNNTGNSRLKNKILNERRHKNPQQVLPN